MRRRLASEERKPVTPTAAQQAEPMKRRRERSGREFIEGGSKKAEGGRLVRRGTRAGDEGQTLGIFLFILYLSLSSGGTELEGKRGTERETADRKAEGER
jgi:hypothetical protein